MTDRQEIVAEGMDGTVHRYYTGAAEPPALDASQVEWLVYFARKSKGTVAEVAARAIEQNPYLRATPPALDVEDVRWLLDNSVPTHDASCASQDDDAECFCGTSNRYEVLLRRYARLTREETP
jgi:hypothetical protein